MSTPAPSYGAPAAKRPRLAFVPLTLFGVAGVLLLGPFRFSSPVTPETPVPAWVASTQTVRSPNFKPEIRLGGFSYHCSDCHRLFESPPETDRELTQHREVQLNHGMNTRCFNCHNRTNRDTFVDDWGHEIAFDQPQLLCAKCHGPVYRDWLHGAHGRVNGYWNTTLGAQQRRRCTECHDPHHPPFPPMPSAPAPHTLRMGDQQLPHEHEGVRDPLRVYREMEDRAAR